MSFCCSGFCCLVVEYWVIGSRGLEGKKEMFYLTTHSTHFIYGFLYIYIYIYIYMYVYIYIWLKDIWRMTTQITREETRCRYIGYSFRLAVTLLYASSHRQDNTHHSLCYTSRGALAGMINSSMGPSRLRGLRCSSVIKLPLLVQWVIGSIPNGGLIELFFIPANAPQLV